MKTISVMKKSLAIFLLISVIGVSSYCVAQDQAPQSSSDAVTIPPPLSGSKDQKSQTKRAFEIIEILTSDSQKHLFNVEIADTPEETRKGLMFRRSLDKDKGMLFIFPQEIERRFWMKNTYIPLDILFVRSDGVIRHIARMTVPESLELIPSNGPALAVLEIAGGQAAAHGINIGDQIIHSAFDPQSKE